MAESTYEDVTSAFHYSRARFSNRDADDPKGEQQPEFLLELANDRDPSEPLQIIVGPWEIILSKPEEEGEDERKFDLPESRARIRLLMAYLKSSSQPGCRNLVIRTGWRESEEGSEEQALKKLRGMVPKRLLRAGAQLVVEKEWEVPDEFLKKD